MTAAEWNGMAMPNDCILLIADQGFGDSIHFSRFIPLAAARVGRVVLACSPEMERLLAQVEGVGGVYSRWEAIPPHAMHCLLSSLPRVLGTEVETIPAAIPYLTPDAGLRTAWNERLRTCLPSGGKPLVGVVWAGRAVHPNDKRRSLRLETLAPLTGLPGIQIISLQKPVPEQDRDHFAALGLHDWSDALTDFSETLALLSMLDLVVSVGSAVAHLTGAAGVRVWTLLPNPADWRWMKGRRDTPWYPSMRLFRQGQAGDWVPVIRAVAREAEELFGTRLDPVAEQRLERDPQPSSTDLPPCR